MFRRLILGSVSVIALSFAANAADMYRAPEGVSYKDAYVPAAAWTGFYAGVNGGWGGSSQASKLSALGTDPLENVFTTQASNHNIDGGFGGGQIGYNWQLPGGLKDGPSNWLIGVEADIQAAGLQGSSHSLSFSGDSDNLHTASASSRLDWFGTLRGRLGYTAGNALFYGTGGLAFGGVKNKLNVTESDGGDCNPNTAVTPCSTASTANNSTTRTGYVVGGGIEYLFSPRWSVKAEYQYIDLGTVTQAASATVTDITDPTEGTYGTHHVSETFNTVRAGINYHFGAGYEALK